LRAAGVPLLPGRLCATPEAAGQAAAELGGEVVVKAQVQAGGRGKAGGIRLADGPESAAGVAGELLGQSLLGYPVRKVLVEPRATVERELYLAFALDVTARRVVVLIGPGGVDVEERPEAIWRAPVDLALGLPLFLVRDALHSLGLSQALAGPLHGVAVSLLAAFRANAATLAEINPLALTPEGLVALDARMVVDDGALERVPELLALVRENAEEFPDEHLKLTLGFDYLELDPDGDVGLISTGAGLTMTVIDLLRERGARPINFVDLRTGGMGRDPTRLRWVLDRVTARRAPRAVLVNIFAGITDLVAFAEALLAALEPHPALRDRIVVRITGNGFAEAAALCRAAGLVVTEDLGEAIELTMTQHPTPNTQRPA
jgi:succinyl-CoA synthetase beta subunit